VKQKLPLKNRNTEKLEKILEERGLKGKKPKVKGSIPKPGKHEKN